MWKEVFTIGSIEEACQGSLADGINEIPGLKVDYYINTNSTFLTEFIFGEGA
jgi:hypothetical protein